MENPADASPPSRRRARPAPARLSALVRLGTAAVALGALSIVLAACGSSTPSATPTTNSPTNTGGSGSGATTTTASGSTAAIVKAASTSKGTILETSAGMPLYTLAPGTSCTGQCAAAWPPLTVPTGTTPKAGAGVTGTLATKAQSNGALWVTYNGKALYTFLSDSSGQVTGDGVAGFSVAKAAAASTSSVAPTTSSTSGYHY
jgi:predicted lipoprotein with Yx(FWY)xxD motif